jgi:hypothetical protein
LAETADAGASLELRRCDLGPPVSASGLEGAEGLRNPSPFLSALTSGWCVANRPVSLQRDQKLSHKLRRCHSKPGWKKSRTNFSTYRKPDLGKSAAEGWWPLYRGGGSICMECQALRQRYGPQSCEPARVIGWKTPRSAVRPDARLSRLRFVVSCAEIWLLITATSPHRLM